MADEITLNSDVGYSDNHPSVTAGGRLNGKDLPAWNGLDGLESDYIRCQQCGFVIKRSKHSPGNPYGNIETEYTIQYALYDDADVSYDDLDVTYDGAYYQDTEMGGCPFCHSSNYE